MEEETIKDGICKGKGLCEVKVMVDCAFCTLCGWFDDPVVTPADPYENNQHITTQKLNDTNS